MIPAPNPTEERKRSTSGTTQLARKSSAQERIRRSRAYTSDRYLTTPLPSFPTLAEQVGIGSFEPQRLSPPPPAPDQQKAKPLSPNQSLRARMRFKKAWQLYQEQKSQLQLLVEKSDESTQKLETSSRSQALGMWFDVLSKIKQNVQHKDVERTTRMNQAPKVHLLGTIPEEYRETVEHNVSNIGLIRQEVKNFYLKTLLPSFLHARVLLIIDQNGKILDYNHHIYPVPGYEPSIKDDSVFESWYKTNSMFQRTVKNNPEVWEFAKDTGLSYFSVKRNFKPNTTNPWSILELAFVLHVKPTKSKLTSSSSTSLNSSLKKIPPKIQERDSSISPSLTTSEEWEDVDEEGDEEEEEARVLREEDVGDYVMIVPYDNLCFPLNARQATVLEATVNQINQKSLSLTQFNLKTPLIVCPYVFILLKWNLDMVKKSLQPDPASSSSPPSSSSPLSLSSLRLEQSVIAYRKKVKFYLSLAHPYLAQLYERAQAPTNLGLRGMLVPSEWPFDV